MVIVGRRYQPCSSFMKWIYACILMSMLLTFLLYDATRTFPKKHSWPRGHLDVKGKLLQTASTTHSPPLLYNTKTYNRSTDIQGKINGIEILGDISEQFQYAVYGATTQNGRNFGHAFYLPLTAKAWNTIGFRSLVILIGTVEMWHADKLLHLVFSHLRQENATIVFIDTTNEQELMMSQVSRIFIQSILTYNLQIDGNPYMITSDADIWPLDTTIYLLPKEKEILSLNSECCGRFMHGGKQYRMLPMANIGMKHKTWLSVILRNGMKPTGPKEILRYLYREFGDVVLRRVEKGDNLGWYLDQRTISILIQDYTDKIGNSDVVHYVPRNIGHDRLDRSGWDPRSFGHKVDAHLPENPFLSHVWARLMPLLNIMHGQDNFGLNWCIRYFQNFQDTLFAASK